MNDPLNGALCRVDQGDALAVLPTLPEECVHFSMTSPPYWKLRSYLDKDHRDKEHELGSEPVPDCNGWATGSRCNGCYLCRLLAVFAEVKRVLRDDGVLVVNLGDSYVNGGHEAPIQIASNTLGKEPHHKSIHRPQPAKAIPAGLEEGSLCGIPWRFALAMQSAGWCLRSSVIWGKRAPMCESLQSWRWEKCRVKIRKGAVSRQADLGGNGRESYGDTIQDKNGAEWEPCPGCKKCTPHGGYVLRRGSWRPTRSHEHVFVFTRGGPYWCDGDAVRTPAAASTLSRDQYSRITSGKDGPYAVQHDHETPTNPLGANLRDVLTLGPEPASCACIRHPAPDCPVHAGQPGPIYVDRPPASWKRCTCEKTLHFAAFPSTLCRPFLEAFCPQRCCAECGTGWVRVVERETVREKRSRLGLSLEPTGKEAVYIATGIFRGVVGGGCSHDGNRSPSIHTLGWRPACNCQSKAEPVPGLCLDPFSGTGTLALTARRMGLRALGIELSEGYAVLSRCRLQADQPLFNGVVDG